MATKTIRVTKDANGNLVIKPMKVTLIQNRDKMKVKNGAELTVFWQVPDGPLFGSPFRKGVFIAVPSAEHKAKPHATRTEYPYQITSNRKRVRRKLSDPIIIIDVERRNKVRRRKSR